MTVPAAEPDLRQEDVLRYARVIPLDVVQRKGSGHAGTAVSLSLYLQLYLHGYGLEMDDLRAARTLGSRTPGHPEWGHTAGVETTTGPLGQGIGNAVGMAMAARRVRGMLDPEAERGASPFDHRVFCLASDGDIQEGISHEASSLAGHLGLDNLTLIWDDNEISIEGPTGVATSEDVSARMAAYGWAVLEIHDAESAEEIRSVLDEASRTAGRPTFIRLRTRIGGPMPTLGGTAKAHSGAPGEQEVRATKTALGLDPDQSFAMPPELLAAVRRSSAERAARLKQEWSPGFGRWQQAQPRRAAVLDRLLSRQLAPGWDDELPVFAPGTSLATRIASSKVVAAAGESIEELWGGSADLADTNGTFNAEHASVLRPGATSAQWPGSEYGKVIHFGIREHAMGAILNGIALNGLTRVFGATFFVFSDYMRPAVRLAALMGLPVVYIWTHDSVAVGEDGPTHEPVEHLWSYRAIPGLAVVRPGDANETVAAYRKVLTDDAGPTAMVLSRQSLPTLEAVDTVRRGTAHGGYVLVDPDGTPDLILIGTGSELHLAVDAAAVLEERGVRVRVVSMPCIEWFDAESEAYREGVLPAAVTARVSIEAGIAQGWYRFVGTLGETVSVESFGLSGNGSEVLERLGVSAQAVLDAADRALRRGAPVTAGADGS